MDAVGLNPPVHLPEISEAAITNILSFLLCLFTGAVACVENLFTYFFSVVMEGMEALGCT